MPKLNKTASPPEPPRMSDKQRRNYLKQEGTACPYCKSLDLTCAAINIDGGTATQEIDCNKCEKEWTDIYVLKYVEPR